MRGKDRAHQGVAAQTVVDLDAFGEVFIRARAPGRRKIEQDQIDHGAHAGSGEALGGGVWEKIHVVDAGDAATNELCGREPDTVQTILARHVRGLGGPDVVLEPVHQGQVICQAAHEAHRRVCVRIHQPGHQRVAGKIKRLLRAELCSG